MGGFPGRLDFHVVHQLLAAGQPDVRGDNALMGLSLIHKMCIRDSLLSA